MLDSWIYTILSVVIISLISLVGIVGVAVRKELLKKVLFFLVSFSVGALLGGAFIHLLPETFEEYGFGIYTSFYVLGGILVFFVLEKFIHWRHCHIPTSKDHPHPFAYMNLIGDSLHNFIDGMVIAGSYLASIPLGFATTLAVVFHEIPQEMGDFGVLVHGGFKRSKALMFNFLTALTAVIGAVVVLIIGVRVQNITSFLLPFTAGGFIYIAGSDLIPELHKECNASKSVMQLIAIVLGMMVMAAMMLME
ncbi:MAG: ZIP family metal transporter [Nanoarchaeota archaeon]|nr:ZIP family metal transporter [Nanoarchaeota archaeon]